MEQKYAQRKSIRNSLSNAEKEAVDSIKNAVHQNHSNKRKNWIRNLRKNWDKYVYTFCILFSYLFYGLCSNLFGPAMVDMQYLFHTSINMVGYANSFASVGYVIGSLTGFLYKYINRQMSFIVNLVILGVFIAVEPLCTSLWQFYGSFFLWSWGGGVWDSGNAMWAVEMWKENSSPVLQLSQMMYGGGSIIGPLLMKPFVYGDLSNQTDTTTTAAHFTTVPTILETTTALLNITNNDDINYSVDRRSKLRIPYLITGGLTLTMPIILLVMFFVKRYKIPEKQAFGEKSESNPAIGGSKPNTFVEVSPLNRKILIVLVALSLNSYSSFEQTYFNYNSAYYQYLPIHLSASTAAQVMAVMASVYTVGRGVSAFISTKLKAETMLIYHIIIQIISLAVLHFGQNSLTLIYLGNAMIGFGFSAMWPAYFSFSEQYIKLTDRITSIYSFTSTLFALAAPFVLGPYIDKKPEMFLYVEFGLFSTVIILFIIIMFIIKRSQRYPISYRINE